MRWMRAAGLSLPPGHTPSTRWRAAATSRLAGLLALLLLGACETPPPGAYVNATASGAGEPVGANTMGEACTRHGGAQGEAEIYCGTWSQPSARIRPAGAADAAQIAALARVGAWRESIDARYACRDPRPTTILGDAPALLMECTRRTGGWPHLALVASVGGQGWLADGVLPALPAMERAIGLATGRSRPEAAGAAPSGAEALLAERLAARAFGANDIGTYQALIAAGSRANQAENAVAAETAYRAALGVQERALGADDPALGTTLALLALQLSNQGRFPAAEAALARADTLAAKPGAEAVLPAWIAHYRALHLLNRGRAADAVAELDRAASGYTRIVPPALLTQQASGGLGDQLGQAELLSNPQARSALLGLIEVRRYRGVALRALGRGAEAEEALRSAQALARANRVALPIVSARLTRSAAVVEAQRGEADAAATSFSRAAAAFARGVPGTRPVARTELLRAGVLARLDRPDEVLEACRTAVSILGLLRSGIEAELLEPCLAAWATAAERDPANGQALLAEMFAAAQLAQSGVTSRQIDQASVRLAGTARDPQAGAAIRRYQDAQLALGELLRERDENAAGGARGAAMEDMERRIAEARAALAEADDALQAAAPRYGQLVQQAVGAREVLAALRPEEAFASIVLTGPAGGWTFVLRDGRIAAAPVRGGQARIAELVRRVRASIERTGPALPRFDTAAAAELHAATLGPLAAALEGATALAVAPSGPLLSLPFEVLLTGPADADRLAEAPFLLRRMTIAHVPAAANFVGLRRLEPSRAPRAWFGFGEFRPPSRVQAARSFPADGCAESAALFAGLPPLPGATRELEAARQLLGATTADRLVGSAFTAEAVRRAALRQHRVLHFATHAVLPAEIACQPEPAILASTPPDAPDATPAMLTASAVADLDLDADLVILSACNSGGPGGSTAGESLSGLARAFFYAGARALVVTHWAVDDQMAAYLVAKTLAIRREGQGTAAALRAAQLSVLEDAGQALPAQFAHPFYWAAFAVIGEGGAAGAVSLAGTSRL